VKNGGRTQFAEGKYELKKVTLREESTLTRQGVLAEWILLVKNVTRAGVL
jgi:hypothetical protein